jgi:hypothetical protein
MKIIVIDDEPIIAGTLVNILEELQSQKAVRRNPIP